MLYIDKIQQDMDLVRARLKKAEEEYAKKFGAK